MKEAPGSSETSVLTRATRRNNPENTILDSQMVSCNLMFRDTWIMPVRILHFPVPFSSSENISRHFPEMSSQPNSHVCLLSSVRKNFPIFGSRRMQQQGGFFGAAGTQVSQHPVPFISSKITSLQVILLPLCICFEGL
jgi:hypothetical protein